GGAAAGGAVGVADDEDRKSGGEGRGGRGQFAAGQHFDGRGGAADRDRGAGHEAAAFDRDRGGAGAGPRSGGDGADAGGRGGGVGGTWVVGGGGGANFVYVVARLGYGGVYCDAVAHLPLDGRVTLYDC